ncbi:orotidine-5'-phosphate decarboxylase [Elusimicrobiota bacterium]
MTPSKTKSPYLIVSLDVPLERALAIIDDTKDLVPVFKVGPALFNASGIKGLEALAKKGAKFFIDLKLHDIPNTVSLGLSALFESSIASSIWAVTLHTLGGYAMLKAAREQRDKHSSDALLLGVTVLTSLKERDLYRVGINRDVNAQVKKLAILASDAGLDGVIASSGEISAIRKACGKDFLILTPGIKLEAYNKLNTDQKRVASPQDALEAGSNGLIIGRDIYNNENPRQRVEAVLGIVKSCYGKVK